MRPIHILAALGLIGSSCLVLTVAAFAQSTEAESIHMACLVNPDARQRMEACTAAINSSDLKPTLRDDAHMVRASLLLQQGRFDEARADLIAARQLDSGNAATIDAAIAKIEALQSAAATPEGQERLAFLRCRTEPDVTARVEACNALVASSLDDPAKEAAARALRAAAEIETNDFDAAIDDLDKAIALDDSKTFYREIKARTLYFSGDYSGALASYRRLEGVSMSDERTPIIAALEYLAGDRQRAISFYRSAYQSGPPGNVFLFYAALIQSELEGGKVDAFNGLHFGPLEGPFAEALLSYRLGTADAVALLDSARQLPVGGDQAKCMAEFNIGHRLALERNPTEAKPAFRSATELCPRTKFEYHAAKAWLKKLGG